MSSGASPVFGEALQAFRGGDLARARALAEQGVQTEASPNWHHLLGLVLCRLGEPGEGVRYLEAAAAAEPANAGFRVMLARALIDSGRGSEVLAMPEPPPIDSAASLALWQARAEAADSAAEPAAAAAAWAKVATASPNDWRALSNLANALAAQGHWIEAAEALGEAVSFNSGDSTLRTNAVAALLEAGRQHEQRLQFDDGERAFRRAYDLEPGNPSVVQLLGVSLERINRLDELEALIERASGAGIGDRKLNYLRALLARRRQDVDGAHALLLASDAEDDPVRWHALRAKIADSLGNSSEAYEAAVAMNRAAFERLVPVEARDEWNRKTADYRSELHALARTITPAWAERVPRLREPTGRRLSFLLGFPRSGTTLLDTFLMGHPDVAVLEEKQLVGRAGEAVGGCAGLAEASEARLRASRDAYFSALAEHGLGDFDGLVVDKFPLDMAAAPVIEAVFPGAPLIFAQRHPCDVVLSAFMQPIGLVNFSSIKDAADYYDAMMSIWTSAREAMDLKVHTVVYEELVQDPEAVLRPLLIFLGLDWNDRLLDHRRTAMERGTITTPTYDQVTEPITTRATGRWKRYREQLEPALPILLPWAERLGYRD